MNRTAGAPTHPDGTRCRAPGVRHDETVRLHRTAALAAAALCACAPPPRRATAAVVAHGEEVARTFCYACHDAEGTPRAANPLQPRLHPERWASPEQAYANIGRLSQLNPSMTLAFQGSDEDRRALAAYVADLARRNRPPPWRTPLALAAGAAMVASAAAWARRRARTGATARDRTR